MGFGGGGCLFQLDSCPKHAVLFGFPETIKLPASFYREGAKQESSFMEAQEAQSTTWEIRPLRSWTASWSPRA